MMRDFKKIIEQKPGLSKYYCRNGEKTWTNLIVLTKESRGRQVFF